MTREWMMPRGSSKRRSWRRSIVLLTALVLWPITATATMDNLKCFKIKKDELDTQKYSVDLDGLKLEAGCQVASKAKYLCVPGEQTNFSPMPPAHIPAPPAPPFVCYKAKCPKTDPPSDQTAEDKFGSRTVQLKKTALACVPLYSPSYTRCCNLATSSPYMPVGCFDYVANVNSTGEYICKSTNPFNGNTIAPPGEVCGGISGVCGSEHVDGGSCCSVSVEPLSFCIEGNPAAISSVCAFFPSGSATVIPNATCQIDGTCVAQ